MRTLVVLGLLAACGSKSANPETVKRSYTIDGVTVSIVIPSSWKEELGATSGAPVFRQPGTGLLDGVYLGREPCPEDATDMAPCLELYQRHMLTAYKTDVKTEQLGPGRSAVTQDYTVEDGRRALHACVFAYHAPTRSVVTCNMHLAWELRDKLPEARRACDSLAL